MNRWPIREVFSNAALSPTVSKTSSVGVTSSPGINSRKLITSSSAIRTNSRFSFSCETADQHGVFVPPDGSYLPVQTREWKGTGTPVL